MDRAYSRDAVQRRRDQRRQTLEAELNRITAILAAQQTIRRVILFGSLARGESGEHSDLDLVVVQETAKPFLDWVGEIQQLLLPRVDVDLLVYTPAEFEELATTREFVRRLRREGKVVYESAA